MRRLTSGTGCGWPSAALRAGAGLLLAFGGSSGSGDGIRQDPWPAFDAAYARAQAEDRESAWLQALERFLAVRLDAAGRRERVGLAAWAAWRCGDDERAVGYAGEAWELGVRDDYVIETLLWASERGSGAAAGDADAVSAVLETVERHGLWQDAADAVVRFLAGRAAGVLAVAPDRLRARGAPGLWPFEALAQAYPDNAPTLANLALSCYRIGSYERAEELYERACELAPDDEIIRSDFGLQFKGRGMTSRAIVEFRASRELDPVPGQGPATNNLCWLHARGRPDAIADPDRALRALLRLRPENAMARRSWLDRILARRVEPEEGR